MQQQSKCYDPLRHMIQLIRTNCLFAHGLIGITNPNSANPLKPELEANNTRRAWKNTLRVKIDYLETMIYFLESVLGQIKARDWQIKTAVEWKKFLAGM